MTGTDIRSIPVWEIMRNIDHVLIKAKSLEGERGLYYKVHKLQRWTKRDWGRIGPGYVIDGTIYQIMFSWRTDSEAPK